MGQRDILTAEDVKTLLLGQVHRVVERYAPPAQGSYSDRGQYFTLNPGRADRKVGSFVVNVSGPRAGTWHDFATKEGGDLLDLIALNLGCNLKDAFREARSFLGLQSDSPADTARRKAAAEEGRARMAAAKAEEDAAREKRRRQAQALWLSGRASLRGTPVEAYLRDARGIDLAAIGRQPGCLRFHPACWYRDVSPETFNPETGEVIPEVVTTGQLPALLSLVTGRDGQAMACHRTWLDCVGGHWQKARLSKPKKVFGEYRGGASIRIWRGLGPTGKRQRPLQDAEPGSTVYVTEGVEDALSVVMALPQARVLAAISLSNMGAIWLPETIAEVVLVADRDEGAGQKAALQAAIHAHQKAGRRVRLWLNQDGGKDVNDALRAAVGERRP